MLEVSKVLPIGADAHCTQPSAWRRSREHVANGKFEHKGGSAANYSQVVAVRRPVRILHPIEDIPGRTAGKAHPRQYACSLPASSSAPLSQQGHFSLRRYSQYICIAHIQRP
ncbi:MAG TPA: hypothetical protein VFU27_05715, partial [Terriglobales bacterium]|nr:hypothetical protein [Terriglobales bacterium]